MSFPTTSVIDDFNGANQGPPPDSNWNDMFGGMIRDTNQCKWNNFSHGIIGWNPGTFTETEAYVKIVTMPAGLSRAGLYFRFNSLVHASADGYFVYAEDDGAGSNTVQAWKILNGSLDTQLGSSIAQTVVSGDSLGISMSGNIMEIWYKSGAGAWTSLGTRTDSTYSSAGYIGLRIYGTVVLDDFGGGEIVTATGQPLAKRISTIPFLGGSARQRNF